MPPVRAPSGAARGGAGRGSSVPDRVRDLAAMSNPPEPQPDASGEPGAQLAPESATPADPAPTPDAQDRPVLAPGRAARANGRLVALLGALALVVAVVDQLTKAWAQGSLDDGHVVDLVGSWLTLQLVYNSGAALSIGTGATWLLTIVVVVVIVAIVRVTRRLRSTGWAVALGLLLGGAVGNLVDRLLRAPSFGRGRVVDFIGYGDWFVGNVADIAIVVGAVLVALLAVLGIGIDGRRSGGAGADRAAAGATGEAHGTEGS